MHKRHVTTSNVIKFLELKDCHMFFKQFFSTWQYFSNHGFQLLIDVFHDYYMKYVSYVSLNTVIFMTVSEPRDHHHQ